MLGLKENQPTLSAGAEAAFAAQTRYAQSPTIVSCRDWLACESPARKGASSRIGWMP